MNPGVRCHGMKANPTGKFCSKYIFFLQRIYTRLPGRSPCFKIVIYTAAVQEAQPNRLYARQPGVNLKLLFTRQPVQIYTRLPCVHIKSLFTRQPFKNQIGYIYCCRVNRKNRYLHGSRSRAKSAIYIAAACIHKIVFLHGSRLRANSRNAEYVAPHDEEFCKGGLAFASYKALHDINKLRENMLCEPFF